MFKSNVSEHPTRFAYISIQGRMIHWRVMEQYSVISNNFAFPALTSWLFHAVRSLTCACAQNCRVHLSVSLHSPRRFLPSCLLRYLLFLRFSCWRAQTCDRVGRRVRPYRQALIGAPNGAPTNLLV